MNAKLYFQNAVSKATRFVAIFASIAVVFLAGVERLYAQSAYDRDEQIRRSAEKLQRLDEANREDARKRYDKEHPSGGGGGGGIPVLELLCCGSVVLVVVLAFIGNKGKEK